MEPGRDGVAADRLAGFCPAQLDDVATRGLFPEVVIEGHDAVDLGARQVERVGDHRQGFLRHTAELFLHAVEDGKERAFALDVLGDHGLGPRLDLGTLRLHRAAPSLYTYTCRLAGRSGSDWGKNQ